MRDVAGENADKKNAQDAFALGHDVGERGDDPEEARFLGVWIVPECAENFRNGFEAGRKKFLARQEFERIESEKQLEKIREILGREPLSPEDIKKRFIESVQSSSPITNFGRINRSVDWRDAKRCPKKAYILACLSEASYLHIPDFEVAGETRLKLFTETISRDLAALRVSISIPELTQSMALVEVVSTLRLGAYVFHLVLLVSNVLMVVVRGSVGKRDWAGNFMSGWPILGPTGAQYHLNFCTHAKAALPLLLEEVGKYSPRAPIYFAGHSRGGAIAAILAQIWPAQERVWRPYVFGCPRFGNAVALRRQTPFAYVNPRDVVPDMPPKFSGYADPEIEYISIRNGAVLCSKPPKSRKPNTFAAKAHEMARYRRGLGFLIGEDFPALVYKQALDQVLAGRQTALS